MNFNERAYTLNIIIFDRGETTEPLKTTTLNSYKAESNYPISIRRNVIQFNQPHLILSAKSKSTMSYLSVMCLSFRLLLRLGLCPEILELNASISESKGKC